MSGGGGKGGSKTTETTIPDWIKDPAVRNLQRAEDVQRIEYMPYYGADVAAFNPMQNAAMNNNISTAQAFGLLDPNSTLTATTGMPTPTDFDGFSGYSSQPMYESALAELKAKQPDAVAQYDALFGAPAMAQLNASRNSGRGGNVSFNVGGGNQPRTTSGFGNYNSGDGMMSAADAMQSHMEARGQIIGQPATGDAEGRANYLKMQQAQAVNNIQPSSSPMSFTGGQGNYTPVTYSSSRFDSKGYTPKK